jgi:hypothetical protein
MNASRQWTGDVAPLGREVGATGFARGAPLENSSGLSANSMWFTAWVRDCKEASLEIYCV